MKIKLSHYHSWRPVRVCIRGPYQTIAAGWGRDWAPWSGSEQSPKVKTESHNICLSLGWSVYELNQHIQLWISLSLCSAGVRFSEKWNTNFLSRHFLPNFSVPRFLFLFSMYFSLTSFWISAFLQSCHPCLLPRLVAVTEEVCLCLWPCAKSEEVLRRCPWGLPLSSLEMQIHSCYLLPPKIWSYLENIYI